MAVYTEVTDEELAAFLAGYDIGELLAFKGIAEGVENSNSCFIPSDGFFILTLYEKRVRDGRPAVLPRPDGASVAATGITCPQPVRDRPARRSAGSPGGPAAIVTFLDGMWVRRPSAPIARASARRWRELHLAGDGFPMERAATRFRSRAGGRSSRPPRRGPTRCRPGLATQIEARARRARARLAARTCRSAIIHADLFPDNVFFLGERRLRPDRFLFRLHRCARL